MVPQTELRVSFQAFGLSSSNTIFARRTSTQSGAVSVLCCCTHLPITICGVHLDPTPDLIAALLAAHSDAVAERLVLCCGAQLPIIICGVHLDPTPDLIAAVLAVHSDAVADLFCLSIKCDFDRDHSHPIMMPIRRGENVFCTESGLTFGNPAHSVQLPGSINFFLTSGKSKGARTITLGRGNGLIMDGKQHYPLRATVLEDHHDYIPVLNSPAIKVGIEFVGDIPTMSESAE